MPSAVITTSEATSSLYTRMYNFIVYFVVISAATGIAHGNWAQLTVHKQLATWKEAHLRCQRQGGLLVSPINGKVLNAMKSLMSNDRMYHIGTRAGYSPGTYLSLDGVPLENMTDVMDNMIEELDPLSGDCLAMNQHNVRLVPCWTRLQYICSVTQGSSNMKDTCGPSEEGYKYNPTSQKCYKVHRSRNFSWDEGNSTCNAEGGRLAVVENENDKQSVMSMYEFDGWFWIFIGLRDSTGSGDWKSVDGRRVEDLYNIWVNGAKTADGGKPCGAMHSSGKLQNLSCNDSRHFICERKPNFLFHSRV